MWVPYLRCLNARATGSNHTSVDLLRPTARLESGSSHGLQGQTPDPESREPSSHYVLCAEKQCGKSMSCPGPGSGFASSWQSPVFLTCHSGESGLSRAEWQTSIIPEPESQPGINSRSGREPQEPNKPKKPGLPQA